MPTANWIAWAAEYNTKKVSAIALTIRKVSNGATSTLYLADVGGVWDGTHYYEGCVLSTPSIEHSAQSLTHGRALPRFGQLAIALEPDAVMTGSLCWCDLLSGDYAWAGGTIVQKLGGPDLAWADWATVLNGYIETPAWDDKTLTLNIYDSSKAVLDKEIPPNIYEEDASNFPEWEAATAVSLGYLARPTTTNNYFYEVTTAGTTGGTEPTWGTTPGGTTNDNTVVWTCRQLPDSLIGKPVPIVYGQCLSIEPKLIDETSHLYQFNDSQYGPCQSLDTVYIDGKSTGAGFTSNLTYGWIKFAADPAGTLTLDVKGRKPGGAYINLPGEVYEDILETFGGVVSGDIDSTKLSAYNTAVPHVVGAYIDNNVKIGAAIDSVLCGLLTIWGVDREGTWVIEWFSAASGAADLSLTDIEGLKFSGSFPEDVIYKATIKGERNWTKISKPDSTATEDRRAWVAEEYRQRYSETTSIKTAYPLAKESGPHETCLYALTACQTVAGWWVTLFGTERRLITLVAKVQPLAVDLGDVISITRDTWGLSAGVLGRVVRVAEYFDADKRIEVGILV